MPGEGQVPQLALSWELYSVTPAHPGEMVAAVACGMVANIVFRRFWVISPLQIKNEHYLASDCTNHCCLL